MKAVLNNPYRILGLLVGTSAKEEHSKTKKLSMLVAAEQSPPEDFSFLNLGRLDRSIDSINDAISRLNLDNDRMNAALFWFYIGNHITDEPALDLLKENNQKEAIEIWEKMTASGMISQRNSSAYNNLSTLLLCNAINGKSININLLEKGVSLKLNFLESDFVKDFKASATDETFKINKKDLQLMFLNQLQSEIDKNGSISSTNFLKIINKQDFIAKEDFLKSFVQKPIEQIEKKIDETKNKRKADKSNAINIGLSLYEHTSESLTQLKSILGISNIKYSSISDKISDEILQCGIDYFSHYKDSNTDPGAATMDLFLKAKTLAIGNIAKQRCQENTENLQEWIADKPERDIQNLVIDDLKAITGELEKFRKFESNIETSIDLINACKTSLANIKLKLGANNTFYMNISTAVASNAQGKIISVLNDALEKRNSYVTYQNHINNPLTRSLGYGFGNSLGAYKIDSESVEYAPEFSLESLKNIVHKAWEATILVGTLDMDTNQKVNFEKNKNVLKEIYKKVDGSIVFFNDQILKKWTVWIGGILLFILIVALIGGEEGLEVVFSIAAIIGVFIVLGFLQSLSRK